MSGRETLLVCAKSIGVLGNNGEACRRGGGEEMRVVVEEEEEEEVAVKGHHVVGNKLEIKGNILPSRTRAGSMATSVFAQRALVSKCCHLTEGTQWSLGNKLWCGRPAILEVLVGCRW